MKQNSIFIALFLLLFSVSALFAQENTEADIVQKVEFKNISKGRIGFPEGQINSIAIDQNDTKWVATESGLVAFYADSTVRTFNRAGKYDSLIDKVSSIRFDKKGTIWLGTFSNDIVSVVNLDTYGEYIWHTEIPTFSNKSFYINAIDVDSKGGKWIATAEGGLWHIAANNKKTIYNNEIEPNIPSDRINAVTVDNNDVVWVGTSAGMFNIKNGKFQDAFDVTNSGYGYDNVLHIDLKPDGNLCVTALNRKEKQFLVCNQEMFQMSKRVTKTKNFRFNDVVVTPNENVWIAGNEGVVKFSKDEDPIFYDQDSGLVVSAVTALAYDINGDIWLGTPKEGLFKMQFKKIEIPKEAEILAVIEEKEPIKIETEIKTEEKEVEIETEVVKPEIKIAKIEVPKIIFNEKEIKKGEAISLENIEFNIKSYSLNNAEGVQALVDFMKANPKVRIEIAGHTDRDPHPAHPSYARIAKQQLDLSRQRVETVYRYLTDRGIDASRIEKKAYGGTKPIVNSNSALNRRVEMKILEVE
ncbi:OmpA family protein [Bernardetia sp. ABR2-2B]|uniref:OmpA family protein n=1 Tax=Bernardetia sp. ABR2-2B TaxID=3127472 RepID=UPI0030CE15DC